MLHGANDYYKYPTALAPTYGRWAPVAHGGALPLGAGAPHRGAIMPHLCVTYEEKNAIIDHYNFTKHKYGTKSKTVEKFNLKYVSVLDKI